MDGNATDTLFKLVGIVAPAVLPIAVLVALIVYAMRQERQIGAGLADWLMGAVVTGVLMYPALMVVGLITFHPWTIARCLIGFAGAISAGTASGFFLAKLLAREQDVSLASALTGMVLGGIAGLAVASGVFLVVCIFEMGRGGV